MSARNVRLIARRELRERLRSRGYRIATVIGVLLVVGLSFVPVLLTALDNSSQTRVAVVGRSTTAGDDRGFVAALSAALPETLPNGEPRIVVEPVEDAEAARRGLERQRYDGVLLAGHGDGLGAWTYRVPTPDSATERVQAAVSSVVVARRLSEAGLDAATVDGVFQPVPFDVELTETTGSAAAQRQSGVLLYALLLLLFVSLTAYGSTVSAAIVAEKSTRISEILMSSVAPLEHVSGKLLGIGLAGLLQYVVWVATGGLLLAASGAGAGMGLAAVPAATYGYFVLFFVLGFALYGTLSAALSSAASRMEDAAQLNMPVGLLMTLGFVLASGAAFAPTLPISVVTSMVPFFTPMVMFARVTLSSPPGWQIGLSVALTLLTIAGAAWTLAKVYRITILLYGKRPTLSAIIRLAGQP